ncbi:otolin-1-A isoform X1 [Oncorhynchus kisutch]|uniref:Otolin-1 n=1 Tax=Oncorhynchus kisutch TaxID=8019 RepID=A0A8C7JBH0_ONCKI|nr:otolin-1 isoform X1 [Oncorhynchus kisutch]
MTISPRFSPCVRANPPFLQIPVYPLVSSHWSSYGGKRLADTIKGKSFVVEITKCREWSEQQTISFKDQCTPKAADMPSLRLLAILTTLLAVVLMATQSSATRTTRRPKPQNTKKPPRGGGAGGGGGGGDQPARLGFRQTTTTMAPSSSLGTDETTEDTMTDAYSLSPTDSTTYAGDAYPTEFHTDSMALPGAGMGNYTLDYSHCYLNVCECCPPEKGPVGPPGERGPPGPGAERGLPGVPGEKGDVGLMGPPGLDGMPGATGLEGDKGDKGDQGDTGMPGAPGILGKEGQKGDLGPKGEKGETGLPGLKGDLGERGKPGWNGTQGEKGDLGKIGPAGPSGLTGPMGQNGQKGEMGECPTGEKGEKGEAGLPGPSGPRGLVGPPGVNGTNGLPGPVGLRGQLGSPGGKGEAGGRGPPGLRGMPGPKGEKGPKGPRGVRGPKGPQGETAEQIRSAFSVGLFPSKSFPPPGLPVKFDKVLYNEEEHWDPMLSKFNCTHPGVYVFSYHITVRNRPLRAALVINGVKKLRTRDSLYGQDIDQASNLALLRLASGDQVWLETLRDWNGVYSSSEDDSTFTGFLLYADPKA